MLDWLGVALVLFVLIVMPIGMVVGGLLVGTFLSRWFRLRENQLDLDRERFERDVEVRRIASQLPPWIDATDPIEVSAWRNAVRETVVAGRRARAIS